MRGEARQRCRRQEGRHDRRRLLRALDSRLNGHGRCRDVLGHERGEKCDARTDDAEVGVAQRPSRSLCRLDPQRLPLLRTEPRRVL